MATKVNGKELQMLLDMTPAEQNVMLVGRHGIGKSEILTHYFAEKGMQVVTLFLGQMSDPGDLIGLPQRDTKQDKTIFLPPWWFPTDGKPIVLFLDELNRARPEVLQTIMDLTLNRELAGRRLPAGSRIISAVNDGEEYQLTDLDPALVSRFNIYNFSPTAEEWLLWAAKKKIDHRIIAFIQENPKLLDGDSVSHLDQGLEKSPDRRAWVKVSNIIAGKAKLTNLHKKVVGGIVGLQAAAAFFNSFAENKILDAGEVLFHYDKHKATIAAYELHELAILDESIARFFEGKDFETFDNEKAAKNLEKHIDSLLSSGKKESVAHFISLYESGNYPQLMLFILQKAPTLYKKIGDFVKQL